MLFVQHIFIHPRLLLLILVLLKSILELQFVGTLVYVFDILDTYFLQRYLFVNWGMPFSPLLYVISFTL